MTAFYKTFIWLTITFMLSVVSTLPIVKNLKQLERKSEEVLNIVEYSDTNFVRIKKETVRVGNCSEGRKRYYGRCKIVASLQDQEYDYIDSTTKVAAATEQAPVKDNHNFQTKDTEIGRVPSLEPDPGETMNADNVVDTEAPTDRTESNAVTTESEKDKASSNTVTTETQAGVESNTVKTETGKDTVVSTPIVHDNERLMMMRNLMHTLLMLASMAILSFLIKLLYDRCYRREEYRMVSAACTEITCDL